MEEKQLAQFREWLRDVEQAIQALNGPNTPHAQRMILLHALELIRQLRNTPTDQRLETELYALVEQLKLPTWQSSTRTFYQRDLSIPHGEVLRKTAQLKFSGPRDQCPKCGLPKDSCTCK